MRLKGRSHTSAGSLCNSQIPIRAFGEADRKVPGYVEVDLVANDGGSGRGEFSKAFVAVVGEYLFLELAEAIVGTAPRAGRLSSSESPLFFRLPSIFRL